MGALTWMQVNMPRWLAECASSMYDSCFDTSALIIIITEQNNIAKQVWCSKAKAATRESILH